MSTHVKSRAANGVYQRISMLVVDLAANAADIQIDNVRRQAKIDIPDMLQQHCPRHDLTLVADQIF
jgi:chemotaxis regulatin CheY-phosphate phosphatase CheZ